MPEAHVSNKIIPFAAFSEDSVPLPLVEALKYSRECAVNIVAGLSAKRTQILADEDLNNEARERRLGQAFTTARVDLNKAAVDARTRTKRARDDANAVVAEKLLRPGDQPEAISGVQATVRARADLAVPKFSTDGDGKVVLQSGGTLHQLLAATLERAPLEQCGTVVLGIQRLDPLTKAMLGGEAAVEAARSLLETRAAAENPAVKGHLAERDAADRVASVLKGDESSVYVAAYKAAFGRPPPTPARPA